MLLDLASLLPMLLVSALVFGPMSGFLARRAGRSPIVWLLFGATLGPIAVLLVVLAPPQSCPVCGSDTRGWSHTCLSCGLDLRSGRPPVGPGPVARHTGPAEATHLAWGTPRRIAAVQAWSRGSHTTPSAAGSPEAQSNPAEKTRKMLDTTHTGPRSSAGILLGGRRAEPAAPRWSGSQPALVPLPGRPRIGQDEPPATESEWAGRRPEDQAGEPIPTSARTLLSAVCFGSSWGLTIGARYGLALDGPALLIVGPLDQTPSTVRVGRRVESVEATGLEDRLLISAAGSASSDRFYVAFVQLAGMTPSEVERTIGDAARDAERSPVRPVALPRPEATTTIGIPASAPRARPPDSRDQPLEPPARAFEADSLSRHASPEPTTTDIEARPERNVQGARRSHRPSGPAPRRRRNTSDGPEASQNGRPTGAQKAGPAEDAAPTENAGRAGSRGGTKRRGPARADVTPAPSSNPPRHTSQGGSEAS